MIKKNIDKILSKSTGKRICIIGDIMLDRYMLGDVTRISPEAPVQVFDIKKTEPKLGGAANVSLNVKTLKAEPFLIGVIGKDIEGDILKQVLKSQGQTIEGLIETEDRPTTCKTRVIASSHHLLRIDSESKKEISNHLETKIVNMLNDNVKEFEIIILQDYNKGVLTKSLIRKIFEFAKNNNIKILVDPKFDNFFEYKNAYIFKPNRKELEDAFGRKAKNEDELIKICNELLNKTKCCNLVLTLGEHGMKVFNKSKGKIKIHSIKTKARNVSDVSGAGDTVISTLAVTLAGGANIIEAVEIANIAAGIVVEEVGIVPIEKDILIKHIEENNY
ncbi:MAG: D-glycero-beta-D-manno-heptose-7-phosphate kinase [Ignavibacteriae bacterium]|nr:D-glycero-beta-D-manno-heptose-7-phosphate kinase [Ignavibacteriota bacterium]